MKFSAIPHISLLLVAGVPAAQATRPCSVGESEDDILVTIARMGFYRQDRDGVVPEARDHSVGGNGPSPFVVEVFEEGLTGFTAENSTFDGMVRFDWGQISFEEVALFWTGNSFGFDGENPLKAAVSSASPRFRFEDEDAAFDVTLPVATWDLPTPQVTNFGELQEIDPAKPVMLRWNPLVGNAAAETLLLQIREFTESGFRTVFTTTPCQIPFPVPGVAVMQSSATFFTLPANLLTNRIATYSAELSVSRFHGSRSGNFGASWRVDATDEKRTSIPLGVGERNSPQFVTGRIQVARNVGDGVFITAIPDGDGLLRLDSSFNLSLWKPWRTNAVVAGVSLNLVVSEGESVQYFRVASP